MLGEHRNIITISHKALDILLTILSFIGAYLIKKFVLPEPYSGLLNTESYRTVLLLIVIIWYIVFNYFQIYGTYRKTLFYQIFLDVVKAVMTSMAILFLVMYILKITDVSRLMMGIFFLLNICMLGLSKGIVFKLLARYRQKGFNFKGVLIVGSREGAKGNG